MAAALREQRSSKARKVLRSLPQREIESPRSLEEPEPSVNDEHRKPEKFNKPTINTKSKAVERTSIIASTKRFKKSILTWKQPKFERDETLQERRASQARKVLQTYLQQEIESRRSLRWPQPSENHDHRSPEKSYKSTAKRDGKPPKFQTPAALRERLSSEHRNVLGSLPQSEIGSRRSLRWPQPSENHDHRRGEKFYEVYRNARWKAADVSDGRSPPRKTIIGAPKGFTNLPPTGNRKPPKFEMAAALREPRSSKPRKVLQVYRNARWKAADVSDGRSPPRTTIIGAPKRFGKPTPKRDWKPPKFEMATAQVSSSSLDRGSKFRSPSPTALVLLLVRR
ncbi:hypothetical protein NPIL_625211 [Nephila pilipes]|uniref:Uncharacterized protein n=1 Tax=Nephila pilipes TaxID=299642 RepID=A0A8X6N7X2_NEPPI|nr:hypothetical protein NPIL_625211 [Nephila pilipes]